MSFKSVGLLLGFLLLAFLGSSAVVSAIAGSLTLADITTFTNFSSIGNTSVNYTLSANISAIDDVGGSNSVTGVTLTWYLPYGFTSANATGATFTGFNSRMVVATVNIGDVSNISGITYSLIVNANISAFPDYYPTAYFINASVSNGTLSSATTKAYYALNHWVNPRPGVKDRAGPACGGPSAQCLNPNSTVHIIKWNQTDPVYQMMTPLYTFNQSAGMPTLAGASYADVMYFGGKEMVERPNWMRMWGYNLTFRLALNGSIDGSNTSGINYWIYNPLNDSSQTLLPLLIQTFTGTDPMENASFNMTIAVPAQQGFSIWYNGVEYNDTSLAQQKQINITFSPQNQKLYFMEINASSQGNLTGYADITLYFTVMNLTGNVTTPVSPVYVDSQSITGFSFDQPPKLGENITTTYIINVSNRMRNYTMSNVRLHFFMPVNVTVTTSTGNQTFNLAQNMSVKWFNSTGQWDATGVIYSVSNMTINDTLPGSPSKGNNINIWFRSYDVILDNFNSWLPNNGTYMSNVSMNMTAYLSFPPLNETPPPTGSAGTNQYNVTVSMSMEAGLNLTDKTPGLTTGRTPTITVDGATYTSANYTLGSLYINNLDSGTHSISVTYSVPAPSAAPVTSSAAAAAAGGGGAAVTSYSTISAKSTVDLVKGFMDYNRQCYIAPAELLGVIGAAEGFPTSKDEVAALNPILFSPVKELAGDVYTLAGDLAKEKYKNKVVSKAVIARGDLNVDSIAAIAYAKVLKVPILLVEPKSVPQVTESVIGTLSIKSVVVVGGPDAVADAVKAALPSASRIGGANREETAVKIAESLIKETTVNTVVITDGQNPSLNAVVAAVKYNAPVVYVSGDALPEVTKNFLKANKFSNIVFAGTSAAAEASVKAL